MVDESGAGLMASGGGFSGGNGMVEGGKGGFRKEREKIRSNVRLNTCQDRLPDAVMHCDPCTFEFGAQTLNVRHCFMLFPTAQGTVRRYR